jgi:microcystin-dependent protein
MRGAFAIGANGTYPLGQSATNSPIGSYTGEATHTLLTSEMPAHTHPFQQAQDAGPATGGVGSNMFSEYNATATSGSTGGGSAHNNIPPYVGLNYIIKF